MLDLPSDQVTGLHTGHPDEPPGIGNTLFHHSFAVHFQRAVKGARPESGRSSRSGSVISGTVSNAAGHVLLLTHGWRNRRPADVGRSWHRIASTDWLPATTSLQSKAVARIQASWPSMARPRPRSFWPCRPRWLRPMPERNSSTAISCSAHPARRGRRSTLTWRAATCCRTSPPLASAPTMRGMRSSVVLMGAVEDIPQATEDALRQAGCQVQRISGTPQQIQDGLRQLDTGEHQIFLPMTPLDVHWMLATDGG